VRNPSALLLNEAQKNTSKARDRDSENPSRKRAGSPISVGISQEELADLCGLHRTYVGAIERAERNVTLSTLEVFSKALGVSVPDLLTPKTQRHDKNS
jgi:DNA-binding Xre family transcriptional regulator